MADNLPTRRVQAQVIESRHQRYYEPKASQARAPRSPSKTPRTRGNRRVVRSRPVRDYSPTRMADKSTAGIGLLEAEFLTCLGLLVLIMFSSPASYSDKIMSLMKRGTLTFVLFFLLALISSIGNTATKIAQAFGGLVVVAMLVTSPMGQVFKGIDNLIKNDWIGTGETGTDTTPSTGSSDSGSQQGQGAGGSTLKAIEDQMSQWFLHLPAGDFSKLESFLGGLFKKFHL